MKLLPFNEPENTSRLYIPEGTIIAETLLQIIKYRKLYEVYSGLHHKDPILLINAILDELDLKYEIPEEDLNNIPPDGPFITVSNHPYRGIDSMLLLKLVYNKRKDIRIMANYLLQKIEALQEVIIPVSTYETVSSRSSFSGIKEGILHLRNNGCLGIFPTGEGSAQYEISNTILDNEWQVPAIKFIKNAKVPVVPVYFHGTNSRLIHIVRMINPLLKAATLPSEIRNKKKRTVKIRIGTPITVKEQSEFRDTAQYGRYLRARTYSLCSKLEPGQFFNIRSIMKKSDPEPLTEPVPRNLLEGEFNRIRCQYELFSIKNFSVICAPIFVIPQTINEIGRLRELTFREVGEGTNKNSDIDEYDLYYNHLFIWDDEAKSIVGAYRIGKGKEIAATYGLKGFYITSLFRIKRGFIPVLKESLELGRSFIVKEYQKKAMPLFLLWKGIMIFLLRNPEYRYLIGPVSMSNEFSRFSKSLIVEFIKTYFFDREKAKYIVPRKEFVVKNDNVIDREIFIDVADRDINKIERIIMDIEPGYRIPVLLRKYLELNSKIIGFNVDPKFNDCLDGLMIMDLYNAPPDFYKALSKDLKNDSLINQRFRF
ncbi:MAG: GNAT family N-acyltransferase [Bacteroidota bacterium]|nr:GNAT family N-acyltransferase [Bacteroidota bacterium]